MKRQVGGRSPKNTLIIDGLKLTGEKVVADYWVVIGGLSRCKTPDKGVNNQFKGGVWSDLLALGGSEFYSVAVK